MSIDFFLYHGSLLNRLFREDARNIYAQASTKLISIENVLNKFIQYTVVDTLKIRYVRLVFLWL